MKHMHAHSDWNGRWRHWYHTDASDRVGNFERPQRQHKDQASVRQPGLHAYPTYLSKYTPAHLHVANRLGGLERSQDSTYIKLLLPTMHAFPTYLLSIDLHVFMLQTVSVILKDPWTTFRSSSDIYANHVIPHPDRLPVGFYAYT